MVMGRGMRITMATRTGMDMVAARRMVVATTLISFLIEFSLILFLVFSHLEND